jgi:beta-lactamase regulating signal transducer with metallopeptidase domain
MNRWLIELLGTGGPVLVVADGAAKATILLGLTTVMAAVLHRSAAAVRHRLWSLTFCGLILLPLLSWSLPGWRLPILASTAGQSDSGVSRNEEAADVAFAQGVNVADPESTRSIRAGFDRGALGSARPPGRAHAAAARGAGTVLLFWALGFIVAMLPAVAGVFGNERRRKQSRRVVDQAWLQLLDGLTRKFALRRGIELRTSLLPLVPVTWGAMRPVVLLPEQAEQWPEPVRRLVLMHELAHIKRWDVGFQLVGRLATAVYWFQPLAWYALHRLRAECECACDDYVVHLGARRSEYAQQLVDLARSLRAGSLAMAVPMTRKNTLEQRIKAIFDERRSHRPLGRRLSCTLLGGGLAVLTGLAAVHPGPSLAGREPQTGPSPATTAAGGVKRAAQESKGAAQGKAPAAPKPPAATPNGSVHETYTHPITITGRALDLAGKPVAKAHVYLASRRADYKRVAETIADGEGRYEFRAVPLPIERANTVVGRDEGVFQVFGEAEGFGFAWRPAKVFYPLPKPGNIVLEPGHRDPPGHYEANDQISLDLRFPRAAHLSGTVVDDKGRPLAGVRLEVRECVSLKVVDNVFPGWTLDALNERDSAPPSMKFRTTDANGRFEFAGLPVDCRFWIHLRAQNFPWKSFNAATTDGPEPDHDGSPVFTGEIKIVFATPVNVPIKIVFGDTGEPAPKVAVSGYSGLVSVLETTDDQGRATLRLPPGNYGMEYLPAYKTSYLVTEAELVVGAKPPVEPVVVKLRKAGILEVTVVDAETGEGVPDVDLWEQTDPNGSRIWLYFRSWEVGTRIVRSESPRTDAQGKLRGLVEPGRHRVGVRSKSYPPGREVVESRGQEVECRAGETVLLKFTLRKRG